MTPRTAVGMLFAVPLFVVFLPFMLLMVAWAWVQQGASDALEILCSLADRILPGGGGE